MDKNQKGLAPVVIVLIVVALITGGILAWQYLGIPQQEEKKILKEREEVTPEFVEPAKETTEIKLYFSNNKLGERNCESAYPVIRNIQKVKEIEEMAKIAINELIKGPTEEEKLQGYYLTVGFPSKENIERHKKRMEEKGLNTSAFDDGVKIKSLEIKDEIAYIDFNIALNVGGNAIESCIITSVKTAVANTLRQFSGIKDVVISVEGREWPCSDFDCVRKLEFEVGKSDIFVETAQAEEGITHLARRALDKYLKQVSYIEEIDLTEEQKVYIEDYLQNKIGSEFLKIGESREFSAELIKEAIATSQIITRQELEKYLFPTSIETGIISNKGEDSATIWIQYLDQNNNLIPEAEVTLNLTSPEKYKYEVKFSKENNYYYVTLYYISMFKNSYCFQASAKKKIYAPLYKDFCIKFGAYGDSEIQIGKFPINYKEIAKIQKSVDEGHQPWYLSPQIVAFDMARNYGFIEDDRETMKNILLDTDTGIAKYEIIHKEKSYIITVIQPVPGEHKVWTLSEIELKELAEDETADWKTYRNEEYGFEMKYPAEVEKNGMYYIEKPYLDRLTFYIPCMGENRETGEIDKFGWQALEIDIAENPSKLSVEEWIEKNIKPEFEKANMLWEWGNIKFKDYNFAGVQGKKVEGKFPLPGIAGSCNPKIYLSRNSRIYIIGVCIYEAYGGPCTLQPDPEEILSTFRFLE